MTEKQRAALVGMVQAVLNVRHIDEFTAARASRLMDRLHDRAIRPNWRFA
jgi:hypothetical protein